MRDLFLKLHALFLRVWGEHPECVSWNGHNLNDSGLFEEAARLHIKILLPEARKDGFPAWVRQEVRTAGLTPGGHVFTGALYAACAAALLNTGEAAQARLLAEEAVSCSQFDLFAQNLILKATHLIDPAAPNLEETDAWLQTRFCTRPFTMIETTTSEEFYRCCPSYLPRSIGTFDTAKKKGLESVLKSPAAQALKDSILDGSFRHCSRLYCPFIGARTLPSREEGLKEIETTGIFPSQVFFSHDLSCNLSCPSCRPEKVVAAKSEQERFDSLADDILVLLIAHGEKVSICGSGDPFASIHFRNLLIQYCQNAPEKKRKLALQTNGVLCDAKAWASIGLYGHVTRVSVSADAATPETYAIVRRGGNFGRMRENMEFLAGLRRQGEIDTLGLCFVVQVQNFKEMPAFAQWGKTLGVDEVLFTRLRNWGTFSADSYKSQNITSPDHPDHTALLDVLKDPALQDKRVNLGDLGNIL